MNETEFQRELKEMAEAEVVALKVKVKRLQAIVDRLPHMDDIETAILAINCGSGDEFREDFCQCDHEVGVTMCMHCAVWDVLCKVKAARLAGEKQGDER